MYGVMNVLRRYIREVLTGRGDDGFESFMDELYDRLRALGKMIGSPAGMEPLRIEPRLKERWLTVLRQPEIEEALSGVEDVMTGSDLLYLACNDPDMNSYLKGKLKRAYDALREEGPTAPDTLINGIDKALKTISAKVSSRETEAPSGNEIFGKFAFAPDRIIKDLDEPNTPEEQDVYDDLQRHFSSTEHSLSRKSVDTLKGIMKRGDYADVFKEPNVEYVYRGMSVDQKWFEKAGLRDSIESSDVGFVDTSFVYPPKKPAESWTTSPEKARQFATWRPSFFSSGTPGEYGVVLVARPRDNKETFVSGPGGLYTVRGLDEFTTELEAIALGPVRVTRVYWAKANELSKLESLLSK